MKLSSYQGNNTYTFLCFYTKYNVKSYAITKFGFTAEGYSENETVL